MANTILIKRGNKANISSLELLPGELGVALDTQELYVGDAEGNVKIIKGGASGAVESADKLTVPRNISISGDGTGSASFDGSKDVTISLALADTAVTAGTYTKVTVDSKGRVTKGENIAISDVTGLQEKISSIETSVGGKADKSTTLAGYGITNAYTKTEVDGKVSDLTSQLGTANEAIEGLETSIESKADKSTTLAGYGITDAYTKGETDGFLAQKADTTVVNGKADKSTTLAGYGIEDAYTKGEVDAKVSSVYKYKGSVANEAALPQEDQVTGDVYNVEDTGMNVAWDGTKWDKLGSTVDLSAYMTTETANSTFATITTVNGKADKATTLQGYGITDAYTKAEVDGKTGVATTAKAGLVKPDGTSITVDGDGTIHSVGKEYTAGTNIEITGANVINNTIPFKKQGTSLMLGDTNFGDDDYSEAENMTMGVGNTIAQVEEEGEYLGNIIMIGGRNSATSSNSVILGQGNAASGGNNVLIGQDIEASSYSIAMGNGAKAGDGDQSHFASIAIGHNAKAIPGNSIAIGYSAEATEENVAYIGGNSSPINNVKVFAMSKPGLISGYHNLAFEELVYSKTEADSLLSQKLGTSDVIDGGTF